MPRLTEFEVESAADTCAPSSSLATARVIVEGYVLDGKGVALPDATIRLYEPRLRRRPGTLYRADRCVAETQTDADGHFRAVVAAAAN